MSRDGNLGFVLYFFAIATLLAAFGAAVGIDNGLDFNGIVASAFTGFAFATTFAVSAFVALFVSGLAWNLFRR